MSEPILTVDLALLEREVIKAICDPGLYAGAKGDRYPHIWQVHAVMLVFRGISRSPVETVESGDT